MKTKPVKEDKKEKEKREKKPRTDRSERKKKKTKKKKKKEPNSQPGGERKKKVKSCQKLRLDNVCGSLMCV